MGKEDLRADTGDRNLDRSMTRTSRVVSSAAKRDIRRGNVQTGSLINQPTMQRNRSNH